MNPPRPALDPLESESSVPGRVAGIIVLLVTITALLVTARL